MKPGTTHEGLDGGRGGREAQATPEWRVEQRFRGREAVGYARRFLEGFDAKALAWIKIRDGASACRAENGFWGTCYAPTPAIGRYRVSCSVKGEDRHFPASTALWRERSLLPGRSKPSLRCEAVVEDVNEGLIWILGHELFHFLAYTGQTNAANTEFNASTWGYEMLWSYREGDDPLAVADRLLVHVPSPFHNEAIHRGGEGDLAHVPHRFPWVARLRAETHNYRTSCTASHKAPSRLQASPFADALAPKL